MEGYIYLRSHPSYENAYKMGKTENIPERDSHYATGELRRGYFEAVYAVPFDNLGEIEKSLQDRFREFNIRYDAGTEFYDKAILSQIEGHLVSLDIKFKYLSREEIALLVRKNRDSEKKPIYTPRDYQKEIIDLSADYLQNRNKGILVLTCGVGKTLIALWVAQKLASRTILIGVPNCLLLEQWAKYIRELFPRKNLLLVSKDEGSNGVKVFLKSNSGGFIIITTYSSVKKVVNATREMEFTFDLKILDEVHHVTSKNPEDLSATYVKILDVPSVKQLSLTATLKNIDVLQGNAISNGDERHFGEIISRKCLSWAIDKKIVCDYSIQTLVADEGQVNEHLDKLNVAENNRSLFLGAFSALKSIAGGHTKHLLIYCNDIENSSKIIRYIEALIKHGYFELLGLYYSGYHSEMHPRKREGIIGNFEKARFGILSCVYSLGEGWDFPLLNGVVFAEKMKSPIRIVQSALRMCRKNLLEPEKKGSIILPILNTAVWSESGEMDCIRDVIYEMGLEDSMVECKVGAFNIEIERQGSTNNRGASGEIGDLGTPNGKLEENLKLRIVERTALTTTYEKAMKIIALRNVILDKEGYYKLCDEDTRLPKDPETAYADQFTKWTIYLGTPRIYYDLETCKREVKKYYSHNDPDAICKKCVESDGNFPPYGLWVDYYGVCNLSEIIEPSMRKGKRLSK